LKTKTYQKGRAFSFSESSKNNIYFSGRNPDFTPEYRIANLTEFRKEVIDIMLEIRKEQHYDTRKIIISSL